MKLKIPESVLIESVCSAGPRPYGAFDWTKGLWAGLAERRRK